MRQPSSRLRFSFQPLGFSSLRRWILSQLVSDDLHDNPRSCNSLCTQKRPVALSSVPKGQAQPSQSLPIRRIPSTDFTDDARIDANVIFLEGPSPLSARFFFACAGGRALGLQFAPNIDGPRAGTVYLSQCGQRPAFSGCAPVTTAPGMSCMTTRRPWRAPVANLLLPERPGTNPDFCNALMDGIGTKCKQL